MFTQEEYDELQSSIKAGKAGLNEEELAELKVQEGYFLQIFDIFNKMNAAGRRSTIMTLTLAAHDLDNLN